MKLTKLVITCWLTSLALSFATYSTNAQESEAAEQKVAAIEMKPENKDGLKWYLPYEAPMQLKGLAWFEQDHIYQRLPVDRPKTVTQYPNGVPTEIDASKCGAFHLSAHTSGGQIRFRTDSSRVVVDGELRYTDASHNIPWSGSSCFDLYYRESDDAPWILAGVGMGGAPKFHVRIGYNMTKKMRDVILYFPTYNGVKNVSIGLDENATLEEPKPFRNDKRVIYYGTSITQGGCSSRAGACASAILGRHLNMEILNYGFSGNGKGEPELATMFASIERPALYILDYEWNIITGAEMAASLPPFIDILKKAHPEVPILLVSHTPGCFEALDNVDASRKNFADKKAAIIQEFKKRRQAGDNLIFFLDGSTLMGEDWWNGLVDGTHPSDLGFERIEKGLYPVVANILGITE